MYHSPEIFNLGRHKARGSVGRTGLEMLSFGSGDSAQVAIVTGAGRGLGRAWAQALAARGVRVVVNDNDADASLVEGVVQAIRSRGGVAVGDRNSVTDGAEIVKTAMENFKRVDILINVWGISSFRCALGGRGVTGVVLLYCRTPRLSATGPSAR